MGMKETEFKTIGQKVICRVLEVTQFTQAALADTCGVNRMVIQDLARGRTKKLSLSVVDAIAGKFPQFNKVWLLTGVEPMYSAAAGSLTYNTTYGENSTAGVSVNDHVGNGAQAPTGVSADIINKLLEELSATRKQNQELLDMLKARMGLNDKNGD